MINVEHPRKSVRRTIYLILLKQEHFLIICCILRFLFLGKRFRRRVWLEADTRRCVSTSYLSYCFCYSGGNGLSRTYYYFCSYTCRNDRRSLYWVSFYYSFLFFIKFLFVKKYFNLQLYYYFTFDRLWMLLS